MKRGAAALIAAAFISVLSAGYLAAAHPAVVYQENLVVALGYAEQGIPTFKVDWPRDQIQVTLEVHKSLAVWSITIRDSRDEVVWTYVGGATGSATVTSGWREAMGSCTGTIRMLGRFNATLTIEAKGKPW